MWEIAEKVEFCKKLTKLCPLFQWGIVFTIRSNARLSFCFARESVVADANLFLVEIFRNERWVGAGHGVTPMEAVDQAKDFIGRAGIRGVRVSMRNYDEIEGIFRKEYIYRHPTDQDHLVSPAPRDGRRRGNTFSRHSQSWLMFAAIVVGLAGNVGLGYYFVADSRVETGKFVRNTWSVLQHSLRERADVRGMVLLDLPTVSTNYRSDDRSWILVVDVSLELNQRKDIPLVRARLGPIVEGVIGVFSRLLPGALEAPDSLRRLQKAVHEDVQSVAGEVRIKSVLFRNLSLK